MDSNPDYAGLSDVDLVAACGTRPVDAGAWNVLYARYRSLIVSRVRQASAKLSNGEVEELTQEVFLRVFLALRKFDSSKGTLSGLISRIARNIVIDYWRRWHTRDETTHSLEQAGLSSPALAVRSGLDPAMVKSIGSLVATSMEGERQRQIASELVRCATVTEVVQRLGVKRREVYAVQQELEPNLIAAFEAARGQKKIS